MTKKYFTMSGKRVAIVIVYLGKFPWYFSYFLHSCKYNPSINFLIITDNEPFPELPLNVEFVNISLAEFCERAEKKLGFKVNIQNPYKLCDFKPAYGYLFDDLLKGYDFWGHGDLDVIYGNIRNFMTDELLDQYEIITVTGDYISGAFTLYKNNQKINALFRESRDFEKVFSNSKHYCFDETNGIFLPFFDGVPSEEIVTEIDSMTHVVKRKEKEKYVKAYFNTHIVEGLPGRLRWIRGTLVYKDSIEAMMFHMLLYKHVHRPKRIKKKLPEYFCINAHKSLMFKYKPSGIQQ